MGINIGKNIKGLLLALVLILGIQTSSFAQPGNSIDLDGSTQYVDLGTTISGQFANSSYTFAAWIKTNNVTASYNTIVGTNKTNSNENRVFLSVNSNGVHLYDVNSSQFITASASVIDGKWHHVAVTINASNDNLKFYLDGRQIGDTKTSKTRIQTGDIFSIGQEYDGNYSNPSDFMDGSIDEVQLWNKVLSQNELRKYAFKGIQNPSTVDNLIGYYPLNGNASDNAGSSSSPAQDGANDGTLKNTPGFSGSNAVLDDGTASLDNDMMGSWEGNLEGNSSGFRVDVSGLSPSASENVIFGHNGGTGITSNNEPASSGYTNFKRLQKLWQVNDNLGSKNVDLTFDLDETGGGFVTYTNASNVVLLKDADNSGNFTEVGTADNLKKGENQAIFNGVDLEAGYYYTIAAKDGGDYMLFNAVAPGKALDFDGSDDYVEVGKDSRLQQTTFTVEAWFKTSGGSNNILTILNRQSGTNNRNYWLVIDNGFGFGANSGNGEVSFRAGDGSNDDIDITTANGSGYDFRDGQWHHAAVSVDNGSATAKLYVDGRLEDVENGFSPVWTGTAPFTIGSQQGSSRYFKGEIDEVRFWDKALTKSEVKNQMHVSLNPGNHSALKGNWRFDDNSWPIGNFAGNGLTGSKESTDPSFKASQAPITDYEDFDATGAFNTGVRGIWQSKGSDTAGGLVVTGSGFSIDENMVFGHNGNAGEKTDNSIGTVEKRLERQWFIEDNTSSKNVDLTFITDQTGTGAISQGTASDYVLINTGTGSIEIDGASSVTPSSNAITFTGVPINSQYTLGSKNATSSPLPVEMLYFRANKLQNAVALQWKTASETNNSHFLVQRNSGDRWENLGKVQGHGTTTQPQEYSFMDNNPQTGTNYYRLKQVDFGGTFEYSGVRAIEWNSVGEGDQTFIEILQNPVHEQLNIRITNPESGKFRFQLVGMDGNIVKRGAWYLIKDAPERNIDMTGLPSGIYLLIIRNGDQTFTKKILK